MKKNVLFLGNGLYSKSLIKYFKRKFFNRYLVDLKIKKSTKNLFKKTFQINLLDKQKIYKISKKLKIDYVITDQNDFAIPTYGYLCSKLKLNGISEIICNRFADKKICRSYLNKNIFCKKYIPKFYFNYKKISKSDFKKKFIVKPIRMQGSRFVKLSKYENLKNIINYYKINNINFIIEEFIDGKDYAVESAVSNGRIQNLAISVKKKFSNSFVDKQIISKNYISNILEKKIINANKLIIKNLNLKNGLTHLEFRAKSDNRIYLIEAACRGAGSGISNIILPYLTNFNTDKFLFNMSLGIKTNIENLNKSKRKTNLEWLNNNKELRKLNNKNIIFVKKKKYQGKFFPVKIEEVIL